MKITTSVPQETGVFKVTTHGATTILEFCLTECQRCTTFNLQIQCINGHYGISRTWAPFYVRWSLVSSHWLH